MEMEVGMPKIDFQEMSEEELRVQLDLIRASRKRRTKRAVGKSRAKRQKSEESGMSTIEKLEAKGIVVDDV